MTLNPSSTQTHQSKQDLFDRFKKDLKVNQLTKSLCQLTDSRLIAAWQEQGLESRASLVAVGGYGRGELFPYSDVDILVLLPNQLPDETLNELNPLIERFITRCWDLGLEIGSSVRTIDECLAEASQDITVRTALLESRLIKIGRAHV